MSSKEKFNKSAKQSRRQSANTTSTLIASTKPTGGGRRKSKSNTWDCNELTYLELRRRKTYVTALQNTKDWEAVDSGIGITQAEARRKSLAATHRLHAGSRVDASIYGTTPVNETASVITGGFVDNKLTCKYFTESEEKDLRALRKDMIKMTASNTDAINKAGFDKYNTKYQKNVKDQPESFNPKIDKENNSTGSYDDGVKDESGCFGCNCKKNKRRHSPTHSTQNITIKVTGTASVDKKQL